MNSRIFTLTVMLLFFSIRVSAQTAIVTPPDIPISNELDFTILVEDSPRGQKISLETGDIYYVIAANDLFFNLKLNFLSESDNVTFYRLKCHFNHPFLDTPPDPSSFGITNPVIIPPIRKKNGETFEHPLQTHRPLGVYPYKVDPEYNMRPKTYSVTVELLKYDNFLDYINNADNFTVGPTATFILNALNGPSHAMERSAADTFSVIAFPNPSTNYVTFKYTGKPTKRLPLNVTVFNSKGVQVSQHNLTSTSTKTNSFSYSLNTSHLQKGRYYFQLLHEGKIQVKTIIKE